MKLDFYLTSHTKINSKLTKDINITNKIIKLLQGNTGVKYFDFGPSNIFF